MTDHQVQPSLHHHITSLTKVWACGFLAVTKKSQIFQIKQRKITVSTIDSVRAKKKSTCQIIKTIKEKTDLSSGVNEELPVGFSCGVLFFFFWLLRITSKYWICSWKYFHFSLCTRIEACVCVWEREWNSFHIPTQPLCRREIPERIGSCSSRLFLQ